MALFDLMEGPYFQALLTPFISTSMGDSMRKFESHCVPEITPRGFYFEIQRQNWNQPLFAPFHSSFFHSPYMKNTLISTNVMVACQCRATFPFISLICLRRSVTLFFLYQKNFVPMTAKPNNSYCSRQIIRKLYMQHKTCSDMHLCTDNGLLI